MNLFFTEKETTPTQLDLLRHPTPIGKLIFNLAFDNHSLLKVVPQETVYVDGEIYIASWSFPECQIEFLKLNFHPHLPEGMEIESCLCGVWRVKSLSPRLTLHFDCYLESTLPRGIIGTPEFGEGLVARSWENDKYKLTIGTDSEEYLSDRAFLQKGQKRPSYYHEGGHPEMISYLSNGLRITLSELSKDDFVQIHFAAAWTSTIHPGESTLYAVNQSPDQILKFCDIY